MQANLCKALVAVALITPASSAFADVVADWNEKAIAFVTPRMTPPAAQRVVASSMVPRLPIYPTFRTATRSRKELASARR